MFINGYFICTKDKRYLQVFLTSDNAQNFTFCYNKEDATSFPLLEVAELYYNKIKKQCSEKIDIVPDYIFS